MYSAEEMMLHIFGHVMASSKLQTIYIAEETVSGDKGSDPVFSFLNDYISVELHVFRQKVQLYVMSASNFKSKSVFWCAA